MTHSEILAKPSENKNTCTLGFGCMRFPSGNKELIKMTDAYMEAGFNYFDTAYAYGDSEERLGKTLVSRYPRDSFMIADKMPPWEVKNRKSCEKIFSATLKNLGTDYIDFMLLHSLNVSNEETSINADIYGWAADEKKKGNVRHVGFSFHDSAELLEKLFIDHPEMEFVQLQLNYMDVLRGEGKKLHELALKYDKPIIVMEPMRGGSLANLPSAAEAVFKKHAPNVSVASWANRYAASLQGATCLLSGMSSLEHMQDNIKTFSPLKPITEEELNVIETAIAEIGKVSSIPCTGCNYCLDACPESIEISQCMAYYNEAKRGGAKWNLEMLYNSIPKGKKSEDCTSCGACVPRCPQHINIPKELQKVTKYF